MCTKFHTTHVLCTSFIIYDCRLILMWKKKENLTEVLNPYVYMYFIFVFFSIFQSSSLSWQMTSMNVWFGEYVHVSKKPLNYFFSSSSFFIFKNLFKDRWWCLCKCKYSIRHFIYQWIFVYIQLANNIYICTHIFQEIQQQQQVVFEQNYEKGKTKQKIIERKNDEEKK